MGRGLAMGDTFRSDRYHAIGYFDLVNHPRHVVRSFSFSPLPTIGQNIIQNISHYRILEVARRRDGFGPQSESINPSPSSSIAWSPLKFPRTE
jgi:hypothetical protein